MRKSRYRGERCKLYSSLKKTERMPNVAKKHSREVNQKLQTFSSMEETLKMARLTELLQRIASISKREHLIVFWIT